MLGRELRTSTGSRVFSAWDIARARPAVVRVFAGDDGAASPRAARENRLVAGLSHPHIVSVFDVGDAGGLTYYAMPFIEGESLRARLNRERRLDAATASRVLGEVAGALAYAHRHGLVHRDVRPENIFLETGTDRALLADFGVARATTGEAIVTPGGVVHGQPTYMSPEQVEGLLVDGRSDLYSLGLIGWEMLAGQRPWAGETLYGIIYDQRFEQPPSLDTVGHDVTPRLRQAIERALAKDPAARWPTADDFALELRSVDGPTVRRRVSNGSHRVVEQMLASDAWATVRTVADRGREVIAEASARLRKAVTWPPARSTSRVTWLVAGGVAMLLLLGDGRGAPITEPSVRAAMAGLGARPVSELVPVPPAAVPVDTSPVEAAPVDTPGIVAPTLVAPRASAIEATLGRVYRQLQAVFSEPAARRELGRAQAMWLAGRDRVCRRHARVDARERCEGELSRRRVAELTELLARAEGRGAPARPGGLPQPAGSP